MGPVSCKPLTIWLAILKQTCPDFHISAMIATRRYNCEGHQFLSKTLPKFYKQVLRVIEGSDTWSSITIFRKKGRSALPLFLHGLTSAIFTKNGNLKPITSVSSDALTSLSTLCQCYYKTAGSLSASRTEELEYEKECDFKKTEQELEASDRRLRRLRRKSGLLHGILDEAEKIVFQVMGKTVPDYSSAHVGPGAVAEVYIRNLDHKFKHLDALESDSFSSLDPLPIFQDGNVAPMYGLSLVERTRYDASGLPARFKCVPKDSNRLRGINIEPNAKIFQQMAVSDCVMQAVSTSKLTFDRILFRDQSVNANEALKASANWLAGGLATVDLKDASDRISLELVMYLFRRCKILKDLLRHRSKEIQLSSGELLRVRKYGAMGNGFTFPVMSLILFSLVTAITRVFQPRGLSHDYRPFVFGDDILIDSRFLGKIRRVFSVVGLAINSDKTFSKGPFRESCGTDAYGGFCVTPLRIGAFPFDGEPKPPREYTQDEKRHLLKLLGTAWIAYEKGFIVSSLLFQHVSAFLPLLYWDGSYERITPLSTPFRRSAASFVKNARATCWDIKPAKQSWSSERLRYLHTLSCKGGGGAFSEEFTPRGEFTFREKGKVAYALKKRREFTFSETWDSYLPWSFLDHAINEVA